MSTPPEKPVNAAEEDPTVPSGETSEDHGVATADGPSVAALVQSEDDLPERDTGDEAGVGLGPAD